MFSVLVAVGTAALVIAAVRFAEPDHVGGASQGGSVLDSQCDSLLNFYRSEGLRRFDQGSPVDFDPSAFRPAEDWEEAEEEAGSGGSQTQTQPEPTYTVPPADLGARSETGTNIQVAGVDESDIIKTDGKHLYLFEMGRVLVGESVEGGVDIVGVVPLPDLAGWAAWRSEEMLLAGDRLLVFRQLEGVPDQYRIRGSGTQIAEIDISQPSSPRLLRVIDTRQEFVSARLLGDQAQVVLTTGNRLDFWVSLPNLPRRSVGSERLSYWAPSFMFRDYGTDQLRHGLLTSCARTAWIADAPDIRTTTLLSFDLSRGISAWESAAVIADAGTVYATANSLYVSTDREGAETEIHHFDLSQADGPRYSGSIALEGELISQFALSEFDGHLRVATVRRDEASGELMNALTVFAVDDRLNEVGRADNIAPGESLRAVRFQGGIGYLLTFPGQSRNRGGTSGDFLDRGFIDPLFLLDVSDPADPRVMGELDATGFSTYLHPLGGGRLLGIGPLTESSRGTQLALQASLFDVSDLTAPALLDRVVISAQATGRPLNHRAFNYRDGVAIITTGLGRVRGLGRGGDRWGSEGEMIAVRVHPDRLELEATATTWWDARRALRLGDQLHVLSDNQLVTFSLPDYEHRSSIDLHGTYSERDNPRRVTTTNPAIREAYAGPSCRALGAHLRQSELKRAAALSGVAQAQADGLAASDSAGAIRKIGRGSARARTNPGDVPPVSRVMLRDELQATGGRLFAFDYGIEVDFAEITARGLGQWGSFRQGNWGGSMLVAGHRTLTFGIPRDGKPRILLHETDISEPADARWLRTLELEGELVDAWAVDDRVYVAIRNRWNGMPFASRDFWRGSFNASLGALVDAELDAQAAYRYDAHLIQSAPLTAWLPLYRMTEPVLGGSAHEVVERRGVVVDCQSVAIAGNDSGGETLHVLGFDLRHGIDQWTGTGVTAGTDMAWTMSVALLPDAAFVALYDSTKDETTLHEFALSSHTGASYAGSVELPGALVNRAAIAAQDDAVRIATSELQQRELTVVDDVIFTGIRRSATGMRVMGSTRLEGVRATQYAQSPVRLWGQWAMAARDCVDCGAALVDLSDLRRPVIVSDLEVPGVVKEVWPIGDERLLVHSHEYNEWGGVTAAKLHLLDLANPARPRSIGELLGSPVSDPRGVGYVTVQDSRVFVPLYSDPWEPRRWNRSSMLILEWTDGELTRTTIETRYGARLMAVSEAHYYIVSRTEIVVLDRQTLEERARSQLP